jgi:uncharacterized protein (DUF1501 family)
MSSTTSRRGFLRLGSRAFASAGLLTTLGGLQRSLAATTDTSGYKALVCVFLYGGNSAFNWIVPRRGTAYSTYQKSRSNLALAQGSLLALNGSASDGNAYGFHPSCPELQGLFNSGHAALLCNVGTLVQPTTAAQARAASVALPSQLFSHADQQTAWMTSIADSPERYGWAGRLADLLLSQGHTPRLAYNIDIGGANYWQEGKTSIPYVLGTGGAPLLDVTSNTSYRDGLRSQTSLALLNQASRDPNLLVAEYASIRNSASAKVTQVNDALSAAGELSTRFPSLDGDSDLGLQLQQVARCIKAQAQLGDSRQIFFVQLGGFDTHNGELATQAGLLKILSQNLGAFWNALNEIGMAGKVSLFTASDFGRTLGSNGDGSDHAWGAHHLVLGGAVLGGKYYGSMPSLAIGGGDDMGNGRIVPTTATDQYAATLAHWFGVADADLDAVFPNLRNFDRRNLGFLG